MRMLGFLAVALALSPLAAPAATLFDDDFAAEVAGIATPVGVLNASLTQWSITDGSVDLYTNGAFGLPCASAGCLDLDGSTGNAVRMVSNTAFSFDAGSIYELTLFIAGKNGNGDESLTFGITTGGFSLSETLAMPAGDNGARTVSFTLSVSGPTSANNLFVDHAGGDFGGILLDRVTLTQTPIAPGVVPLPATLPLAVAALAGLGLVRARRRA